MSIRLSEKHGLNPAIPKCFFCNEDKNVIIIPGRLPNDAEAPRGMVWDHEPCDNCKAIMAAGVIFISIDEAKSKSDPQNPWRTGGWLALKDEAVKRIGIQPSELEGEILKKRVVFIPDEAWDALGLPRGATPGVPSTPEEFKQQQVKTL